MTVSRCTTVNGYRNRRWESGLPTPTSLGWYAGSAVLNAQRLAAAPGKHLIEFYEMCPDTRSILRTVLAALGLDTSCLASRVLPYGNDDGRLFDGERYVVTKPS